MPATQGLGMLIKTAGILLAASPEGAAALRLSGNSSASALVDLPQSESCLASWPASVLDHTLISKGDAFILPKNIYTRLTIGGDLTTAGQESKSSNGLVTVEGSYPTSRWNYNGGVVQAPFASVFDWSDFEDLASTIVPGSYTNNKKVYVFTEGGDYSLDNWDSNAQGDDFGNTLVVFNTNQDITLKRSRYGRAFGASVLAPFSKVTMDSNAGFVDGVVIALEAEMLGSSNQMHGRAYSGPLYATCATDTPTAAPTTAAPTPSPTPAPTTAAPTPSPTPAPTTASPTPSPTAAPTTASPTAAPTRPAPKASPSVAGFGDPHLVNIRSEHFDLMQPGDHAFLVIPRGASAGTASLQLQALVTARGDVCEGKMYITGLKASGSWLGDAKQLRFSTGGEALNGPAVLGLGIGPQSNMSVDDFIAAAPSTMVTITKHQPPSEALTLNRHATLLSAALHFGPGVIVRIDWEHQKEKVGFSNWLKLSSWGLGRAHVQIGGLLGEDAHDSVTVLPEKCRGEDGKAGLINTGHGSDRPVAQASLGDMEVVNP